jgi:hypothetical protein
MGVLRKYMHLHQLMSMHENVEVGLARALSPVILPKQINPRAYACFYAHHYHLVRFPLAD